MITIKSKDKNITNEQIQKCINLLPNKYRNLDIEIIFISNKWQSLKYIYLKEFYHNIPETFSGLIRGTSCIYYNRIFMYTCNFYFNEDYLKEVEKLRLINSLYHEIRHQWQRQKMKREFKRYNLNNEYKNKVSYKKQWHEIDANNFASHFSLKFSNQIAKILDIKY